jgi:hypothetical protein
VLDFGIAWVDMPEREAATGEYRFGSPPYMAPERMLGDPERPSGDVYSLGAVLFELLVGRRLGRAQLSPKRREAHMAKARKQFADAVGDMPGRDQLLQLLESMLSFEAQDRPSAAQVQDAAIALADQMPGESLVAFAKCVLPDMMAIPGDEGEPAEGVLFEGSEATLALQADQSSPVTPAKATNRVKVGVAAGLAVALLLMLSAVAAGWLMGQRNEVASADLTPVGPPVTTAPTAAPAAAVPATAEAEPELEPETRIDDPPSTRQQETQTTTQPKPVSEPASQSKPEPVAKTATPVVAADTPRLRAVKFVQDGGSKLKVRCGDVSGAGTKSVLLRNVPVGTCQVSIDSKSTRVQVNEARAVNCSLQGNRVTCS